MKLQDKLKALELSEADIKEINSLIDTVIDGKVALKDDEIKTLTGKLDELNGELTPFKQEKRNKHINSLVKDLTSDDKLSDAIALAGLNEEDDDESIKSKVNKVIESRQYLQKDAGIPNESVKQKEIEKNEKPKIDMARIEGL